MVINVISGNLEAKFIKWYWIELRTEAGFLSHNSTGKLECLREWKPGFFSFAVFFLIMWNYLDIFCNHLVFTGSYPLISLEDCQLTCIQFFKKVGLHFCEGGNRQLTLENPKASLVYFLLWNSGVKRRMTCQKQIIMK